MTYISSKRFTQKKYVQIYTVQDISNHTNTTSSTSTHPLNSQTVQKSVSQTKREAFFKKMCFQIFLQRGERWRAADVCRKRVPDFSCLKVDRSVTSKFEVSFGDFQQFFAAGSKSSRGLIGVKHF